MARQIILLIEPEATLCELLLLCLRKLGDWTVFPAASMGAGWDWLMVQQPDVIVLDVATSEEDSRRFIDDLSHNLATASIPVVLLVSHATWLSAGHSDQVVGMIAKPFNPVTLPIEMASLLGWPLICDLSPPPPNLEAGTG